MSVSDSTFSGYGLGLRKAHYRDFLETRVPVDFVEVISENFMVEGGQPRHILRQIRERYPLPCMACPCPSARLTAWTRITCVVLNRWSMRLNPCWSLTT